MANYTLTHSLTNLTHGNVTFVVVPDTGYALPSAVSVSNGTLVSYDSTTGVIVVSGDDTTSISVTCEESVVIDPVLANNSWEVIKQVCQAGNAADYWALGDTKNIAVSGVGDVPHAIVDLTAGRYEYASDATKHTNVVFQAVPTIGSYALNPSYNVSPNGDTAYNGWDYSTLRASMNSGTIYGLYDPSFTALLIQVKTMAAYSGMTDTLVYSSDKLFIPAAREVKANYTLVQSCELGITQYGFYALNSDADAGRIKRPYNSASATYWWTRSPRPENTNGVRYVTIGGTMDWDSAGNTNGVAPCFAF